MIVEVIAVGTELLFGQIINTNTATIGAALAERGLDAHFQQTVGDNLERIASSISTALDRADAVILTGGIGPTQDDITREAVCAATGLPMVFNDEYAERLREWWAGRGKTMPKSNLRQAYHPEGAELMMNPRGTAPGLAISHGGKLIFCVPGVPAEMEFLLANDVIPRLVAASGEEKVIVSRLIRTWGRSESDVAETLDDLFEGANPSIAFLASASEIKVRITAKADSTVEALTLIEPVETEVRSRLGNTVFGIDDETIERVLLRLLSDLGYTIGTAESMTGGLVAARLTDLPGSSAVVRGGLVAYTNELKQRLLGVEDISSVVDAATAVEMATGAQSLLDVDVAVAVTGSAGPDPLEKPPGTVVIAVATPEDARAKELRYSGDRERIRAYGTTAALQLARLALIGSWWKH
ncbi:MAG: competence/damage-inducible protein A [Acidobacteria bacterium]|nr:competence/damage-inducible protein A [Acidobacteriota bacterium]